MDLSERPSSAFQRHPWEVARARFFRELLLGSGLVRGSQRVLDVGAGDGYFIGELLRQLPGGSAAVAWDLGYDPNTLHDLASASATGVRFTSEAPGEPFQLVLMLDVLEHVADDYAFLSERVAQNLEPGGTALISVPAWPQLFTSHDVALGHHRRYRPQELLRLITSSGLVVHQTGGLFHALTLPRAASRLVEMVRPKPRTGQPEQLAWNAGPLLTRFVELALTADNELSFLLAARGVSVPGLSVWALCSRPRLDGRVHRPEHAA